jgi:D-tagatose-1,6-bisphosphate aldolase subunit GatZ/KbaZ
MNGDASYDLKALGRSRANSMFPGIYSICSAHPWVLEAAMRKALTEDGPLLIEATCNQVNQFGGYSGMTPREFKEFVFLMGDRIAFPRQRFLLGGDHLGPYPWRHLPAADAMKKATDLVVCFVEAGFTKIHLDASMPCRDDPETISDALIAERAAMLAKAAEAKAGHHRLRYVIGTEVPTPGGSVEELSVAITEAEAAEQALGLHRRAFVSGGIEQAWERVVALVVQPGLEFGHENVVDYQCEKATKLSAVLEKHPELIFEAHSTDYQHPCAYAQLVHDGFAILKVGPALTYAMRQALFALEAIERQSVPQAKLSDLGATLLRIMTAHPEHWKGHYHGDPIVVRRLLAHSYSDRVRYYWKNPDVTASVSRLIKNLERIAIPETLLSDYLPSQYERVRNNLLRNAPVALVLDKIMDAIEPYQTACKQ